MKRRKRSNSRVPAKGRLREMADQLWSRAVRLDWGERCAVCKSRNCEAHHLVPRQHEATRYDLQNGIALCPRHHKFDKDVAPHLNAAGFLKWLNTNHPQRANWLHANCRPYFEGTKTVAYYCGVILELREHVAESQFESICGTKFSAYLKELSDEDVYSL